MDYKNAKYYLSKKGHNLHLMELIAYGREDEGIPYIKEKASCRDEVAEQIWNEIKSKYGTRETNFYFELKEKEQRDAAKAAFLPKCPTCSSTNLKKISAASKAANTAVFGVFGTKRHKTFHCNNCGYEW